ncbi:unnamed protein product [Arctogadus glacialis]
MRQGEIQGATEGDTSKGERSPYRKSGTLMCSQNNSRLAGLGSAFCLCFKSFFFWKLLLACPGCRPPRGARPSPELPGLGLGSTLGPEESPRWYRAVGQHTVLSSLLGGALLEATSALCSRSASSSFSSSSSSSSPTALGCSTHIMLKGIVNPRRGLGVEGWRDRGMDEGQLCVFLISVLVASSALMTQVAACVFL